VYQFEDHLEEQDHVMPWSRIASTMLWAAVGMVLLAPVWLFLCALALFGGAPSKFDVPVAEPEPPVAIEPTRPEA
jgi:uncharacterized protein (DUF58 family)